MKKGAFEFYNQEDLALFDSIEHVSFLEDGFTVDDIKQNPDIETFLFQNPDKGHMFLHEAAIIEFKGVLYASWYQCEEKELQGPTPICGRRSFDGGKSWSDTEIIAEDKSGKIMFCPPVYGICDDKLYMFINQMVSPDHIHSLDLYVLNENTDRFELLWSRPIPFKLNTNVYKLSNGKLMLPGRIGEMDGFPNTPAVLISDSGKIDDGWRLVKIQKNGFLPDGAQLEHAEISAIVDGSKVYVFCRNCYRKVPIVYISEDNGESWSRVKSHNIPLAATKMYSGTLSDGRNYIIGNIFNDYKRDRFAIFVSDPHTMNFTKGYWLQDIFSENHSVGLNWHYPIAHEANGKLYVIYTVNLSDDWITRGAMLSVVPIDSL